MYHECRLLYKLFISECRRLHAKKISQMTLFNDNFERVLDLSYHWGTRKIPIRCQIRHMIMELRYTMMTRCQIKDIGINLRNIELWLTNRSYTHTHTHTRTHARTHAPTHAHTHYIYTLALLIQKKISQMTLFNDNFERVLDLSYHWGTRNIPIRCQIRHMIMELRYTMMTRCQIKDIEINLRNIELW